MNNMNFNDIPTTAEQLARMNEEYKKEQEYNAKKDSAIFDSAERMKKQNEITESSYEELKNLYEFTKKEAEESSKTAKQSMCIAKISLLISAIGVLISIIK